MHEADVAALMAVLLRRTLAPKPVRPERLIAAPVLAIEITGAPSSIIRLAVVKDGGALVDGEVDPGGTIPAARLLAAISSFLGRTGVTAPEVKGLSRVYAVTPDAKELLGRIENVTRDARIRQVGAEVHHADFAPVSAAGKRWALSLLDLKAFFLDYSVEEIAQSIGFASVERIAEQLAPQLTHDGARTFAHDGRNVAVVATAFARFRDHMLSRWQVDPLRNRTLASLAAKVFMTKFVSSGPAPSRPARTIKKRRTSNGFRDERRNERVFAGDPQVRLAAARSLWGGMMIAFRRGFIAEPLVELDAVSLYPHCACLQPLPYQRTRWRALTDVAALADVEGFVRAEFAFPVECEFPNLPVSRDGVNRLLFTRQGVTHCTVAELRTAIRLGAQVRILEGHVFEPGDREREHDLGKYMREQLADKAAAQKGSLPYEVSKLLANALVGKLVERIGGSTLLDFERAAQLQGFTGGLGSAVASSSALHGALRRALDGGPSFAPEWASLTIGRGRAIMGEITARSGALLVSTDAVLVRPGADLSCTGLAELQAAGSDMRLEHEADAAFIARNRCYALLKRPENVNGKDEVFAANAEWAVVRTARHGSSESPQEFGETVLRCIAAGRDVAPERVRVRRIGAEEAVRTGARINAVVTEPHRTTFAWDRKRRLLDRDANPFSEITSTMPYASVAALEGAERQSLKSQRRRDRRAAQEQARLLRRVLALVAERRSNGEIASALGIDEETVAIIRQRVPVAGEGQP